MSNSRFVGNEEAPKAPLKKIRDAEPFGSMLLVELLNADEILSTRLHVTKSAKDTVPQAYVLKLGPLTPKEYNIQVGDRVILAGSFYAIPEYDDSNRKRAFIDAHAIKGILREEEVVETEA